VIVGFSRFFRYVSTEYTCSAALFACIQTCFFRTFYLRLSLWSELMSNFTNCGNLTVNTDLYNFVNDELLEGTSISADHFWTGFDKSVHALVPRNRELLAIRQTMQDQIDSWLKDNAQNGIDQDAYEMFLTDIGYLLDEGPDFQVATANVDVEIARVAGPQLVVPITNARYALNAANARFGSLYDALYGTDVIPQTGDKAKTSGYDAARGQQVIAYVRKTLDKATPLANASWADVTNLAVVDGAVEIECGGGRTTLADANAFTGYTGEAANPKSIILTNNELHLQIMIDHAGVIGRDDPAGINDVRAEAAISSIMDCEDSIAAVDATDKILAYSNWNQLMRGTLQDTFEKSGKTVTRKLVDDISFTKPDGVEAVLHGRALMLVRNVGHLMTNPAIRLADGSEVPEGIMDAFMTVAGALPDLQRKANSATGSVYIVKPKMHGPDEVRFATEIFAAVEVVLGLDANTIKMGIMDEERRTTINLKECIRVASERVVFINTGFLDRTGDEIHTSMEAGAMIRKGDMKNAAWISAYENRNVDIGLACGLGGKAQIGKGMWAMPDMMADMMEQKINHPLAGANCAWVPSPTAATLHALHYHEVNVRDQQQLLSTRTPASRSEILSVPTASRPNWSDDDICQELRNNAQGILGYVVRWVDQGVGCSKVPDIHDVGLMEDRATLRISSQHIANWIHHGVCSKQFAMEIMKEMAAVVDRQNEGDPLYRPMADDFDASIAFQAACDLVFEGRTQPSGYTEPVLHRQRLERKTLDANVS
jgi:malate synthase